MKLNPQKLLLARRDFLKGSAAALAAAATHPAWVRAQTPGEAPTLREAAADRLWLGPAVASSPLANEPLYRQTLARQFNIVTPENTMKWGPIHPERNRYDFAPSDAIVAFAQANNMATHGHTLVWHSQNPGWLTGGAFNRDEMIALLAEHIDAVAGRYRGRVAVWDVVNEAFESNGTLRNTLWRQRVGEDYLDLAFRFARQADPHALLVYNDYGTEVLNAKSDAVYARVRGLRANNVPVDGVGFQMHVTLSGVNLQSFARNLQRFADLGLLVFVTEMDVRVPLPATDADLARQAQIYRDVLGVCLRQPACRGFQTWGFTDKHSWIPSFYPGFGAALPLDAAYGPKPAFEALRDQLVQTPAPLYRLDYDNTYFFLTASRQEQDGIVAGGWTSRGAAGYAYTLPDATPGLVALYRLYNPSSGDHFYTTNQDERDAAVGSGDYVGEGVAGWVFVEAGAERKPLLRAYNPNTGQHRFTGDASEYDSLGEEWSREGVACYVRGAL